MVKDQLQRPVRDLRISVTDRCNFRCAYCMPGDREYHFLQKDDLLTFEEITAVAKVFVAMGVSKIRLTGGEPLLRRDLPVLIEMLAQIPGVQDIALTTNGFLLKNAARALRDAGLGRITVSLDSLDPEIFARINGKAVHPKRVLEAMDHAAEAGLAVKVNTVVQRGVNDHEILLLAARFKERGHIIRFIEFMDVGNLNQWNMERVVPSAEIAKRISEELPCEPAAPHYSGEVARRWRYLDGSGEFGLISSVTQPFCGSCTRARISADGQVFTCLFATRGWDARAELRRGGEAALERKLAALWTAREDQYSQLRQAPKTTSAEDGEKVEMFRIGG